MGEIPRNEQKLPYERDNAFVNDMVAGVDGCRAGWIVVRARAPDDAALYLDTHVLPSFDDVLTLTADCMTVAVDMPIGLNESSPRACDVEARKLLPKGRKNSVFPTPVRAALAHVDHLEASNASIAASGKGISIQAFGILPKIREVDSLMTPALQRRVFEVHPELAFHAMSNGEGLVRKKGREGSEARAMLLYRVFGIDFRAFVVPHGAGRDDLYDAAACAWSALRLANGIAVRLPDPAPLDSRGLRMEICY